MNEWEVHNEFHRKMAPTEDEVFEYEEALNNLVEYGNQVGAFNLAAHCFKEERYDLALKYFAMADAWGEPFASIYIGDIWYNGYTDKVDYEKAFHWYSRMAGAQTIATVKLADMYKNGQYVERDPDKYRDMILDMYSEMLKGSRSPNTDADVLYRVGRICLERGERAKAIQCFKDAKTELNERMGGYPYLQDLQLMESLLDDLYTLEDPNDDYLDLWDLYYLLKKPVTVSFIYADKEYQVQSVEDEDGLGIRFGDKWYRTVEDFFRKARIGELHVTQCRDEVWRVSTGTVD